MSILEMIFQGYMLYVGSEGLSKHPPILADISKIQIFLRVLKVLSDTPINLIIWDTWDYKAINKIQYQNSLISAWTA